MMVTDLNYHLETKLVEKLDIMIQRCVDKKLRRDAVLICEGGEGEGKTNSSEAIAYYVKFKTGFPIHMFFRLKTLVEFAQKTEGKIIIWDEPALDSLSTDWYKEANKDLIRLLMMCRKKRHFLILNFVKFHKFPEYVVVDRALGLVHMYTRMKGNEAGRFIYIKKKHLEQLFTTYKQKKVRLYGKLKAFGGRMPLIEQHFEKLDITIEGKEHCTLEDYEKIKDKAIESIGQPDINSNDNAAKLKKLKYLISSLKCPIRTKEDLAEGLKVSYKTLTRWHNAGPGQATTPDEGQDIILNGGEEGLSSGEVEEMD